MKMAGNTFFLFKGEPKLKIVNDSISNSYLGQQHGKMI